MGGVAQEQQQEVLKLISSQLLKGRELHPAARCAV